MDGRGSLFFMRMCLCTFERAHTLLVERRVLMDERDWLPVQQWKCLKHLGPRDGRVTVPHPEDLWTCLCEHTRAPCVGWNLRRWRGGVVM